MIRVAMIGGWHPHGIQCRYVKQMKDLTDCEIACVWDDDEERGKKWSDTVKAPFESDYNKILSDETINAVCITSRTDQHKELIIKAAKAGKNIFTEKPLGMNGEEADEIGKAVKEAGIIFSVALPRHSNREYTYAKKLMDEGKFGEVALLKVRNGVTVNAKFGDHWFKEEPIGGGGAIRDLGCHNIDIACWLLGEPESISTTVGHIRNFAVDDTGVCVMKFKNGAIAELESTFSAPIKRNWYGIEIYGSDLVFLADTEYVTIINRDEVRSQILIKDLPAGEKPPFAQFIETCKGKAEVSTDIDVAVKINHVLDAAVISQIEEKTIHF